MPVSGIEKEKITISVPQTTYQSLYVLAKQLGQTPSQYVRSLTMQHLVERNMPLYCEEDIRIKDTAQN